MPSVRILLVEDKADDAKAIQTVLAREQAAHGQGMSYDVTLANRLSAGFHLLSNTPFDLILLDLQLPDSEGIDTLMRVRREAPAVPVIVLTGSDDDALAMAAVRWGAHDYVVKQHVQAYPHLLGRAIRYTLERQRGQEALREAHAETEHLLRAVPSILIRVSADDTLTYYNSVAEQTFGMVGSRVLKRPLAESGICWDITRIQEAIGRCRQTKAPVFLDDVSFTRADGRDGFLGVSVVPMAGDGAEDTFPVLIFGADVTARKRTELERSRLQDQLAHSQKMEVIGRFAGGIAHDFNNFLQVILGFAWLIRAREPKNTTMLTDLEEIVHAAESASGMVRQLLAFSRRRPHQATTIDINHTIRGMTRLLQQFVGDKIRITPELCPTPLFVKLDPTRLEQILMNLCANARDSMPGGGSVTIRTAQRHIDEAFLEVHPGVKQGTYVTLSIQDTGKGMDPSVAAHIFEPFFTTKTTEKGTGLGLAVVYGLVQQHDGFVHIETAIEKGTTFHLYFPSQEVPAEAQAALLEPGSPGGLSSPADARRSATARPKRRLLVVDDDPAVLRLCTRILQDRYEVTAVLSGQSALEALERNSYHLILSDLRMPNMDGVTFLSEVVKRRDHPPLMAMTGSISQDLERRLEAIPSVGQVIHKPFTAPALLEIVNQAFSKG